MPLRLGPELVLAQPLLAAPLAGVTAAPLRVIYTQVRAPQYDRVEYSKHTPLIA